MIVELKKKGGKIALPLYLDKSILEKIIGNKDYKLAKKRKQGNLYYANVPMAFDIETSSLYDNGEKVGTMYLWSFAIRDTPIYGRTWKEFQTLISWINDILDQDIEDMIENRCLIFVHNLSYEFQFMRKWLLWDSVFARTAREPITAVTGHIEFRDSLILTGKSLDSVSKDLRDQTYTKLVGDLDYRLKRGCTTTITEKERKYSRNDVLVVTELIKEKIEDEGGSIAKIPLTNTGYVRRFVRKSCLPSDKKARSKYSNFIHSLNIGSVDEFNLMSRAFQGGFTHSNYLWVGETLSDVNSIDFTSSYPAQILSKKYPMSTGEKVEIKSKSDLDRYLANYCCIFDVELSGVKVKNSVYDGIISDSKCTILEGGMINNGRVMSADRLITTVTNVDYDSILHFYDMDHISIGTFYIYKKAYLPKPIIECTLDLYKAKTTLKGVKGSEVEYMLKKSMLNSIYGMMVTSPINEEIPFNTDTGDWIDIETTISESKISDLLDKYNSSRNRFLFYPWGVFVTAYARQALYTGIISMGEDYVYSDTDSIKFLNLEKHLDYIRDYDKFIVDQITEVLTYYGIDPEEQRPKNQKGVEKQIGVWDIETECDPYKHFKTLGAKRYIYDQTDGLHITIAGVSKVKGKEYLESKNDPFDAFASGLEIDSEHSGKLTHTYIDEPKSGYFYDYEGVKQEYDEKSFIHLEQSAYKMTISYEFDQFLSDMKECSYI